MPLVVAYGFALSDLLEINFKLQSHKVEGGFLYHPSFCTYHSEIRARGATAVATVATPMLPGTRLC